MNPEDAEKWARALESGRYQQGRLALRRGDQYCCLGVACEVFGIELKFDTVANMYGYGDCFGAAPRPLQERLELSCPQGELENPVRFNDRDYRYLTNLNDAGADFNFTAQVIRDQWGSGAERDE